MTEKLKSCPFCGGEVELFKMVSESDKELECWYAICKECAVQTRNCSTKAEVSQAWNRRVLDE